MFCDICHKKEQTRNLPLYVRGLEGINVCYQCEMMLVEFVRQMLAVSARTKFSIKKEVK